MYNEKLIQSIDDSQSDMLSDLADFISIPSISTDRDKVTEALSFILALGERLGFESHAYLDNSVGVIEFGNGAETLGILSHVDVVSPGDLSCWNTPPFTAVIRDERIFGRGTIDDKGAIIASLYAMKAVLDLGLPLHKKVQLILGTQEEVAWTDMQAYVKAYPLPDYGFTPDGEFPLCNVEKGSLDISMSFSLDEGFGGDMSQQTKPRGDGKYLISLHAGTASNIVPGSCVAEVVEVFGGSVVPASLRTLKASGKGVHSCQPEKGENAIFNMAKDLSVLGLSDNRLLRILNMLTARFKDLYGAALGLYSGSEYYNGEFVHRNVFSPTVLKASERTATVTVNIRYAYGCDSEKIIDTFKALAGEYGGNINAVTNLPAVYVSKDRPFVQAFAQAYDDVSGRKNEFVLAYGGSYAKAIPNVVSWGPIFPEDEDTCHEENEYISIKSLMDNAKIFAAAIGRVALSEESFK